jgi:iron complex transport system substrate-binding protein
VVGKPVVTAARIDPARMSSLEIDEAVRASVRDGRSLYAVDAELLAALRPELVVTQDLCAVCAVSSGELESACPVGVEVLALDPRTLGEVAESVRVLARRLGAPERGHEVAARMEDEIEQTGGVGARPRAAACLLRGMDRPAVLRWPLAAGDDRAGRRRGRPRPRR